MQDGSFDRIYQDYFDPVYRYVLSLSGNQAVAEEITQETFFRALKTLDSFQGKSSLKTWLCSIARNLWISEQRKRKEQPLSDAETFSDDSPGPEESIMRQDQSMHRLEKPYREVFTLRTLGQLSFRDIGELFGKTDNWACVVYHRARAMIRKEMGE